MAGPLYPILKSPWTTIMGKAAEMEFPLIPLGIAITQGARWKARRAAKWEESIEWKPATMAHSPLVEQLREMEVGWRCREQHL